MLPLPGMPKAAYPSAECQGRPPRCTAFQYGKCGVLFAEPQGAGLAGAAFVVLASPCLALRAWRDQLCLGLPSTPFFCCQSSAGRKVRSYLQSYIVFSVPTVIDAACSHGCIAAGIKHPSSKMNVCRKPIGGPSSHY